MLDTYVDQIRNPSVILVIDLQWDVILTVRHPKHFKISSLVQYAGRMYTGDQCSSNVLQVAEEIPKINFNIHFVNAALTYCPPNQNTPQLSNLIKLSLFDVLSPLPQSSVFIEF